MTSARGGRLNYGLGSPGPAASVSASAAFSATISSLVLAMFFSSSAFSACSLARASSVISTATAARPNLGRWDVDDDPPAAAALP
ncbi:hypothetical protein BRADI_1g70008v3 [Brachypodium distachyon]|uniref:Uncharacterized protein n=1 Tax=Brachypodium distachyon TaxID=15368 RepID=A0A0Q3HJN8_BRADI|nr:hypothetical protein BRADI_1g70008v3 [Brachypodium distachyon]